MQSQRQIESARLAHATHLVYEAVQNYQEAKPDHDNLFQLVSPSPFDNSANLGAVVLSGATSLQVSQISV